MAPVRDGAHSGRSGDIATQGGGLGVAVASSLPLVTYAGCDTAAAPRQQPRTATLEPKTNLRTSTKNGQMRRRLSCDSTPSPDRQLRAATEGESNTYSRAGAGSRDTAPVPRAGRVHVHAHRPGRPSRAPASHALTHRPQSQDVIALFACHSKLSHAVCDALGGTRREVLSFRSSRLHAPVTPPAPTACAPVAAHATGRAYAAPGAASPSAPVPDSGSSARSASPTTADLGALGTQWEAQRHTHSALSRWSRTATTSRRCRT
jgi:hypothetical protein